MLLIDIYGSSAVIRKQPPLTCGSVGRQVRFRTDEIWENLSKTAVFRCGEVTRDARLTDGVAVIPHEVLTQPGQHLQIGLYGVSAGGSLVIPTVWATTEPLLPGADPSGDPGLDPTNPVWQQALSELETMDKSLQEMTLQLADVDTALEEILAIQEALLGGDTQ